MNKFKLKFSIFLGSILIFLYLLYYSNFKYYWHDEAFILLYLSGHSEQELVSELYDNQPKTQSELNKFQGVNPEKGLNDTLELVANYSPQRPPLYFILIWLWSNLFGNNELVLRSFSVFIYLVFLPCFYFLNLEIFQHRLPAFIASLLVMVSPRFIAYAVDVWEYGLYSFFIVSSSLLFLKAFNSNPSPVKWGQYTILLLAGLYTHIFFVFIGITHFIYLLINRQLTARKNQRYYLLSFIIAGLMYLPWLMIIFVKKAQIYGWAKTSWNLEQLLSRWLFTLNDVFWQWNLPNFVSQLLNYLILLVFIISLIVVIKTLSFHQSSFIILLIFMPLFSLRICDLIFGFRYASVGRFYLGTLLGVIISVAYLIYQCLINTNLTWKRLSYLGLSSLLILGLLSHFPLGQEYKYQGYGSTVINSSQIINQAENPLVLGEVWYDLIPLSYKLKPEVKYLFINSQSEINLVTFLDNYTDIYIINPSSSIQERAELAGFMWQATSNPTLFKIKTNYN